MYTEGIKIGDDSYLLNTDKKLMLVTTTGTAEQIEQYIQISNQYDEKLEEKFYFINKVSELHEKDKQVRKINIGIFIATITFESFFLAASLIKGIFPTDLFIFTPTVVIGAGITSTLTLYGTKKKKKNQKGKIK